MLNFPPVVQQVVTEYELHAGHCSRNLCMGYKTVWNQYWCGGDMTEGQELCPLDYETVLFN